MNVFITGDRSESIVYPTLVMFEMLRAVGAAGATVFTGDSETGVERFVREIAERCEVEVVVVNRYTDIPEYHALIAPMVDEVVAIHADPHSSSVIASLMATFGDDDLRIVTPADLLV